MVKKTVVISLILFLVCGLAYAEDDAIILARMIYAEARGETVAGKMLVAQCAIDRLRDGTWGNELDDVIQYPEQFAVSDTYNEECLQIAREVIAGNLYDANYRILYFRVTTSTKDWVGDDGNLYGAYIGHEGVHAYYGSEVVPMYIIEQERKRVFEYTGAERLQTAVLEDSGMVELYFDKEVIGVFETTETAMQELQNILSNESEVYIIAQ